MKNIKEVLASIDKSKPHFVIDGKDGHHSWLIHTNVFCMVYVVVFETESGEVESEYYLDSELWPKLISMFKSFEAFHVSSNSKHWVG